MLKYIANFNKSSGSIRGVPAWVEQRILIRYRHDDKKNGSNVQTSFHNEINKRQSEARRSIFIKTDKDNKSIEKLITFCAKAGAKVVYRKNDEKFSHFLAEFGNIASANQLIRTVYHPGNFLIDGKIRTASRFLTFNPTSANEKENRHRIDVKLERNIFNQNSILKEMRKEKTIDNQIMRLYTCNRLSDFSIRLRFLTALQIEEAFTGLFHQPKVLPFGSSINGFGRMNSDLDMVLLSCGNRNRTGPLDAMESGKTDGRYANKSNLHTISNIARNWLHGIENVEPILNARVPIVKYYHSLTDLDCDLSMSNFSGFQMSEIMYALGEMDQRVRPFVFFIRNWAKTFGIIGQYPGQGLSNFMITCLSIFFLQRLPTPILPPIEDFMNLHETEDSLQSMTDPEKLNFQSKNTTPLSELLIDFFYFYSTFDFQKDAPSIDAGKIKANITSDSMYIYNPLDYGMNVSRNVSDFERNDFIQKCGRSLNALVNDKLDAVSLLESSEQKRNGKKIDSFVHNMINKNDSKTSSSSKSKFNIKTVLT